MKSIIESLAEEVPNGNWCHNKGKWCKYHEIKKPELDEQGRIKGYYCHLQEEFVNRKICGINEGVGAN